MLDLVFSGRNLFILYLVLAGGFLQPLFPCNTTKLFTESPLIRHILGFFTLIFFVVVYDTELDSIAPLGTVMITSIVVYLWFIISSKMTANWWLALVVLLGILYLIELYEERTVNEDPRVTEIAAKVKSAIIGVSIFLTIVGFLIYVGEKKLDYKSKFSYATLLLSTPGCKGTPNIRPYWDSLKAAFMEPAGRTMTGGSYSMPMSDTAFVSALEARTPHLE